MTKTWMIAVSQPQGRALAKLFRRHAANPDKPAATAYDLKESRATLDSLCRMGFATFRHNLGHIAFPRSCIYYQITKSGREAFPHVEEGP
jgi:DNA-binding MarR family transcriptional regulator